MKTKVCVIQDAPVFFDKTGCLNKVTELTRRYAAEGCELILFPESFVPGYPRDFSFGTVVGSRSQEGRELYLAYYQNSVDLQGEDRAFFESLAREQGVYLVVGITERAPDSGSLFCSMLYVSPSHGMLGVHRKIKPTGQERVIWAEDSGQSLFTANTRLGRLGGLICWENYMPLARMAMYEKGVEIYLAPTADARDSWTASMRHIALEGRCFVLAANQYITRSMYPEQYRDQLMPGPELMCDGGSLIVGPDGKVLAGPLYGEAGGLVAEIDREDILRAQLDFDVVGHYARRDIFEFTARGQPGIFEEN